VDAPKSVLKPLAFGDSDSAQVGDAVIAIGNPLNVGLSVTTGIVSGTERPITAPNNYTIDGAIQTDAAISSGNSGGPLLDASGSVIGINSQVASAGSQGVAQGVGFAVPGNTVKSIVEQLINSGEAVHGYIGVKMFEIGLEELRAYTTLTEKELRDDYGLPATGAIVTDIAPGGPADEVGIKGGDTEDMGGIQVPVGDVITEVRGEPVASADDVIRAVNASKPGDRLKLTVVSPNEKPRSVEVTLESQPDDA
jgi:S1-C subfamily serine protease